MWHPFLCWSPLSPAELHLKLNLKLGMDLSQNEDKCISVQCCCIIFALLHHRVVIIWRAAAAKWTRWNLSVNESPNVKSGAPEPSSLLLQKHNTNWFACTFTFLPAFNPIQTFFCSSSAGWQAAVCNNHFSLSPSLWVQIISCIHGWL